MVFWVIWPQLTNANRVIETFVGMMQHNSAAAETASSKRTVQLSHHQIISKTIRKKNIS